MLRWKKSGSKLNGATLNAFCEDLNVVLPEEYRTFLLMHNGGEPIPPTLGTDDDAAKVSYFYSVGAPRPERDLERTTRHFRTELELPDRFLPVALVDELFDVLLLQWQGRGAGRVLWWSRIEEGFDAGRANTFAKSLDELLARLDVAPSRPRKSHTAAARKQIWSQLSDAVCKGKARKVLKLIETAGDLNDPPADRQLLAEHPLIEAVYRAQPKVVAALLNAGVGKGAKSSKGGIIEYKNKSPKQLARLMLKEEQELAEIATFLGGAGSTREVKEQQKRLAARREVVDLLR